MALIAYQFADQVASITITREDALNALSREVLTELDAALDQVVTDGARVLVVTGAGRAFVAGADIASMATYSVDEATDFSRFGNDVFRKLERLAIPSIAAVNGFALGGGCELAVACDLRLASEKAIFAQPEVGLGITAGFGGTQRLARLIGPAFAKEMLYTGRKVDAARALAIGLVNSVHAPDELLGAANALAAEIAAQAPIAVQGTKRVLDAGLETTLDDGIDLEVAGFASCFGTWDQAEAMSAFVDKRKHEPFRGQ